MRNTLLTTAAFVALFNTVQAADLKPALVYKAPPVIAESSWTGFYAGLGVGFRTSRTDLTTTSLTRGTPESLDGVAARQPFDGTGFQASPYVGFNWQFAPRWLVGVAGEIGLANQTTTLGGFFASPGSLTTTEPIDGLAVKSTWDASLSTRIGFLITPAFLAYATGGAAWQHYDVTSTCAGNFCTNLIQATPAVVTNSVTKIGWTVGGGLETALGGHWIARSEYRYADFGTSSFSIVRSATDGLRVDDFDAKMRVHKATFGLAYKFGDPVVTQDRGGVAAFAMAPTPVAMSWNGLYVGLGYGARISRTDLATTSEQLGAFPVPLSARATSLPFDGTGFRASPYIGFNWQFSPQWIAGVEGDAGFAGQTTTRQGFPFSPAFGGFNEGAADSLKVKTTWDTSLRGRLGYLLTPAIQGYLTGGVAWQHYEVISTCASEGCVSRNLIPALVENSTTRVGWTAGGGLETLLSGRWLARGEYRYGDFGTASFTIARKVTVDTFDVRLRTHTISFGLAYKFN